MKPGPFKFRAAVPFIFVTAVLDIVAMGIVTPVLPALIEELIGSSAQAGLVNGLFVALWALMQLIAAPFIGSLSDRFGRRPVILVSTAGLAVDYLIMALVNNIWLLALGRAFAGITSASFTTTYAYMADITPPDRRARAFGLIGAAFSGGIVAGPLLGGVLGTITPRAPFWAAGALSALAFLYGALILPESLKVSLRMPFSWRRANPFGAMKLLRSRRELCGLAFLNFLMYFALYAISAVFVLYAADRYGWQPLEVGTLLALAGLLDMIVQGLLVGPTTKAVGDRYTMILGLFAGGVGTACMGLAPNGWWFSLAVVPNALRWLAMAALQSLMTARVSEFEQGQLQGANMSLTSIAGVLSPLFFGIIYSMSESKSSGGMSYPGTAFLIAALVLMAAGLVGCYADKKENDQRDCQEPMAVNAHIGPKVPDA
jgi:DHA1 family tetracycline resistance protein-like MFS transporter